MTRSRRDAIRELAELDVQLAEHLPKSELDALVHVTRDIIDHGDEAHAEEQDRATSIVTDRPTSTARRVMVAERANLLRNFALRRSLLAETLSSTDVAKLLGSASRQTPHDRAAAGTLLAVKDAGRLRYPIWQFDPEGPDGVVEGLPEVIAELPKLTQLGRIAWFVRPKRALGGCAPIDALRRGDLQPVIAEARASRAG